MVWPYGDLLKRTVNEKGKCEVSGMGAGWKQYQSQARGYVSNVAVLEQENQIPKTIPLDVLSLLSDFMTSPLYLSYYQKVK